MPRFLKVHGKPGLLVPHPSTSGVSLAGQVMRYLAQRPKHDAEGLVSGAKAVDKYEPIAEWVEDSPTVRKAIRKGSLDKVLEVVAASLADARQADDNRSAKLSRAAKKDGE